MRSLDRIFRRAFGRPALAQYLAANGSLDMDFTSGSYRRMRNSLAFADLITFSRASSATRINAAGVLESVASNVPRIDHDPVTLECKGLLIEEQRTNLIVYSNDIIGQWGLVGSGVTKTAAPAKGIFTQGAIIGSGGATWHRVNRSGHALTAGSTYSFTVFCAAGTSGRIMVLFRSAAGLESYLTGVLGTSLASTPGAGVIASPSTDVVTGGFIVKGTFTPSVTTTYEFSVGPSSATSGATVVLYGAQLEAGDFPTSYIPTAGAQATRGVENASINTLAPWHDASEGTLFAEFSSFDGLSGNTPCAVSLESDINNRVQLRRDVLNKRAYVRYVVAGVTADGYATSGSWMDGQAARKIAFAMKPLDSKGADQGVLMAQISNPAVLPTVITLLLGQGAGSSRLNGHLRKVRFYPDKTAAELQAITA